jgi:hypothetical protein
VTDNEEVDSESNRHDGFLHRTTPLTRAQNFMQFMAVCVCVCADDRGKGVRLLFNKEKCSSDASFPIVCFLEKKFIENLPPQARHRARELGRVFRKKPPLTLLTKGEASHMQRDTLANLDYHLYTRSSLRVCITLALVPIH